MKLPEFLRHELESSREFFERSARVLAEEHANFAPTPDQYSVRAQIAHAAHTIHWYLDGAFGDGFDMHFEEHDRRARAVASLAEARQLLDEAYTRAIAATTERSEEDWNAPFPEGSLIQGPKTAIVFGILEHTAHHRGALSVYSRLLGLQPLMPYMES